jgi:hypothetical protein
VLVPSTALGAKGNQGNSTKQVQLRVCNVLDSNM